MMVLVAEGMEQVRPVPDPPGCFSHHSIGAAVRRDSAYQDGLLGLSRPEMCPNME